MSGWAQWALWLLLVALSIAVGFTVAMGGMAYGASRPLAHQACRHMDGIPVLTPDSGVVCVTSAIQVADTVVPEYVVGDTTP